MQCNARSRTSDIDTASLRLRSSDAEYAKDGGLDCAALLDLESFLALRFSTRVHSEEEDVSRAGGGAGKSEGGVGRGFLGAGSDVVEGGARFIAECD